MTKPQNNSQASSRVVNGAGNYAFFAMSMKKKNTPIIIVIVLYDKNSINGKLYERFMKQKITHV